MLEVWKHQRPTRHKLRLLISAHPCYLRVAPSSIQTVHLDKRRRSFMSATTIDPDAGKS
jgi:hypothetical protein